MSVSHKKFSNDDDYWIVAESEEAALAKATEKFKVSSEKIKLEQDPDVLDTWYSSGEYWNFKTASKYLSFSLGYIFATSENPSSWVS